MKARLIGEAKTITVPANHYRGGRRGIWRSLVEPLLAVEDGEARSFVVELDRAPAEAAGAMRNSAKGIGIRSLCITFTRMGDGQFQFTIWRRPEAKP